MTKREYRYRVNFYYRYGLVPIFSYSLRWNRNLRGQVVLIDYLVDLHTMSNS